MLLPIVLSALAFAVAQPAVWPQGGYPQVNLLLNPRFEFHSFINHREGKAISYESHYVAFWNTDAWGEITVRRESHLDPAARPARAASRSAR